MPNRLTLVLTCFMVACSRQTPTVAPSTSVDRATPSPVAAADTTWYILDGRVIRREDVTRIDGAQIVSVRHLVGSLARVEYGPSAREIVELVSMRAADQPQPAGLLFVLNGREIPAELFRVLDSRKIASVDILKGVAASAYGDRAPAGVILVTSKTGSD